MELANVSGIHFYLKRKNNNLQLLQKMIAF